MTIEELIERLEKADGPDRELDAAIAVAAFVTRATDDDLVYARPRDPGHDATQPGHFFIVTRSGAQAVPAPLYTSSIDAALTLVPDGWRAQIDTLNVSAPEPRKFHVRHAQNPVIALCLAALRARAQQEKQG